MEMVLLRWADAIFKKDDRIFIVECKLRPDVGALSQLEMYRTLFKKTPEFKEFWGLPVELIFLCPSFDENVEALCRDKGIAYEVWKPGWWKT